jgi:hypothetical protein
MSDDERSAIETVVRAPDPYVTVSLPGVLLVRETEIGAKVLRSALNGLFERLGDRKVSIALTTLDPPTYAEGAKIDDGVTLLRSAFGADGNEPMEEAARRVVRAYVNRDSRIPTARDAVIEAAMIVCRPGPSWNVEEACAVLRRTGVP